MTTTYKITNLKLGYEEHDLCPKADINVKYHQNIKWIVLDIDGASVYETSAEHGRDIKDEVEEILIEWVAFEHGYPQEITFDMEVAA